MILDLAKILRSKPQFQQRLAARPVQEKLAMLDAWRERALQLRAGRSMPKADELHEEPPPSPIQVMKSELRTRRGNQCWPEVNAWRLRLHKAFDEAFASTGVLERPDHDRANEFLL